MYLIAFFRWMIVYALFLILISLFSISYWIEYVYVREIRLCKKYIVSIYSYDRISHGFSFYVYVFENEAHIVRERIYFPLLRFLYKIFSLSTWVPCHCHAMCLQRGERENDDYKIAFWKPLNIKLVGISFISVVNPIYSL